MSKNIVLCLDGTWNGPDVKATDGSSTPTNVQKVFERLKDSGPLQAADNEKEIVSPPGAASPSQVAKYIHGVGNAADNKFAAAAEGAVGFGLVERIVRGYTYLSRVYEAGDAICIVGFSRGAYTARALAGLVMSQGLLDWQGMNLTAGSDESYSAGLAAWERCKKAMHPDNPGLLQQLGSLVTGLRDRVELGVHPAPDLKLVPGVPIQAVAVWDTVGALGVPDVKEADGTPVRNDVFQFADTRLNDGVAHGFHAIAIDETRIDFTPTLWDDRDGIVQVLFPGAHADVGGGYPASESGLANGALAWMVRQLAGVGVQFGTVPPDAADALAIQHRPWSGNGSFYRVADRPFRAGLRLSQQVLLRLAASGVPVQGTANAPYRPKNLLDTYLMADWAKAVANVSIER
jgi:uncharacterized protein (DUF2235 family)